MTWSWKLTRIAGIDVYVHATFVIVVAWIGLLHWNQSHSLAAVVEGVGFILALFACIVLHEFGHALDSASLRHSHPRYHACFPSEVSRDSSGCQKSRCRSCGWRSPDLP